MRRVNTDSEVSLLINTIRTRPIFIGHCFIVDERTFTWIPPENRLSVASRLTLRVSYLRVYVTLEID